MPPFRFPSGIPYVYILLPVLHHRQGLKLPAPPEKESPHYTSLNEKCKERGERICKGGCFSVEKHPPSRSLPKRRCGLRWFFFHTICRCKLGAVSCKLVKVTAADRAAVTTTKLIGDRAHLTGGTNYEESHKLNASRSSGESAREGTFLPEKSPPSQPFTPQITAFFLRSFRLRGRCSFLCC